MTKRVVMIAAAAALSGCSGPRPAAVTTAAPIPVIIARVHAGSVDDTFEAGGLVQAKTTATITARILAPVREVRVSPGDRVRKGATLVVLDGGPLTALARASRSAAAAAEGVVATAAAERASAEAALVLARATHERILTLHAKRSATTQELDAATSALRAAEARVSATTAQGRAAASQLESARSASEAAVATAAFETITAAFDGVVTQKMIEPGNMASPGMPLLRIEDTSRFRLEVRVDESRIGDLAAGTPVSVVLELAAVEPLVVSGSIEEISRAVDADARAFLVKIALPGAASHLRSGAFGRARFPAGRRQALLVPEHAIVTRGQLTSVFVVDDGIARLRLVNVRGNEVLAGLAEGESVVLQPPPSLVDGRRVTAGAR